MAANTTELINSNVMNLNKTDLQNKAKEMQETIKCLIDESRKTGLTNILTRLELLEVKVRQG